ncbi:hypothetical protein N5J06_03900 [Ralstonia sp. CHL-2022]|uniref:Uncharacterized protein n=1 Tax=Ralstonia mojiangensis TaxID=2953895 RepID=A0ABT2L5Y7_9RALS|nr:hypothetical protein [Ralstonia mojiangensis]MCT7310073.1 hypothetical protein [Ralstonia mojiangensis]
MRTQDNQRATARNPESYFPRRTAKLASLQPISYNEALGVELKAATACQDTLAFDAAVRAADGEAWPLCLLQAHEHVYCLRHEDTQPVAVTLGSAYRGTDGVYCPVCDRAFWAVARSHIDDAVFARQPVGKRPDHVLVLASTEGESDQQPKSDVILTRNEWGELVLFLQEVKDVGDSLP